MWLKLSFVSTGCPKSRSSKAFLFISDKRPTSIWYSSIYIHIDVFVFHIICVTGCCCKCYGKGGTIQGWPSPQIFEGKTDGLSLRGEAQGPFCFQNSLQQNTCRFWDMLHTVECSICRPNNFVMRWLSKCMLQMMLRGSMCDIWHFL